MAPRAATVLRSSSSTKQPWVKLRLRLPALANPARARLRLGRSPFQMADGRARSSDHPGVFDLPAPVLALGRLRQLRLPGSRPRIRRAAEFSADHRRSAGLVVAWPDDRVVGHGRGHRVRSWSGARAGDGEDVPRTRDRHVDPHHSPFHQPGHRRPVVGAFPAEAVRSRRLPVEPVAGPPGRNQLGRRSSLGLFLDRCWPTSGNGRRSCS